MVRQIDAKRISSGEDPVMRSGKHVALLCSGPAKRSFRVRAGICTVPFLTWLCVLAADAQEKAAPVGTVFAERQQVAQTRDWVGRVNAIDRVEVQARVKGYLEEKKHTSNIRTGTAQTPARKRKNPSAVPLRSGQICFPRIKRSSLLDIRIAPI